MPNQDLRTAAPSPQATEPAPAVTTQFLNPIKAPQAAQTPAGVQGQHVLVIPGAALKQTLVPGYQPAARPPGMQGPSADQQAAGAPKRMPKVATYDDTSVTPRPQPPRSQYQGPTVLIPADVDATGRVSRSHARPVSPHLGNELAEYPAMGWVPDPDWQAHPLQPITDGSQIDADRSTTHSYIGIVRLPDTLMQRLIKLQQAAEAGTLFPQKAPAGPPPGLNRASFNATEGKALIAAITEYSRTMNLRLEEMQPQGVCESPPGMTTTTINPVESSRVGLHFDSWERAPMPKRRTLRNRVSWNVGLQPRYLLIAPITVEDMLATAGDDMRLRSDPTTTMAFFLKNQAEQGVQVPVYRIEIRPGEGYIAPTEFWIHDATSAPMSALDLSYVIFGRYRLPDPTPQWRL